MKPALVFFLLLWSMFLLGQGSQESDLDFILGKIRKAYAGYPAKVDPEKIPPAGQ